MKLTIKFWEEKFEHENSKEAYLSACKWAATNIVNKVEIGDTFWRIIKVEGASLPTFKLELFCLIDEGAHRKEFCDRCKEFHHSFFVNQFYNCNSCNMITYSKSLEKRLNIKKQFRKERIRFVLDE